MSEQPQTRIQLLDQLVEITHKLRDLEANYKKARDENFVYAEHEVFFQNIFQKANDLILILRERTIILANPKFCEAIGASVQEVIGTDLRQYIHQNVLTEALQKYEERLRKCLKTSKKRGSRANLQDDQIQATLPDRVE